MSDGQKEALAIQALGLLNEQVQARIVHYKSELQTSPELDAITAQVVAQIKAMQAAAAGEAAGQKTPEEMEEQQTRTLGALLARFFSTQTQFATRILKPIGKRIAKLFFESELHEKSKGDKDKVIFHAEQGVYYVLSRYKNRLRAELEGLEFGNSEVRRATLELLAKIERDLQLAFLSRRSPELNRVMTIYTTVLSDFLQKHLPPRLEQIGKVTIRVSRAARRPNSVGYKVQADAFGDFRAEWERLFMQQMVFFCGDELLEKLTQSSEELQAETVKFFTDPHVFSETCEVVCEQLYDFLCLEGFWIYPSTGASPSPRTTRTARRRRRLRRSRPRRRRCRRRCRAGSTAGSPSPCAPSCRPRRSIDPAVAGYAGEPLGPAAPRTRSTAPRGEGRALRLAASRCATSRRRRAGSPSRRRRARSPENAEKVPDRSRKPRAGR